MSKAVLTSIKPEFCNLIVYGRKVYEVRKTRPKLNTPFTSYIYCTKGTGVTFNVSISNIKLFEHFIETGSKKSLNCPVGNGKVIGEFICDEIIPWHEDCAPPVSLELTGLSYSSIRRYWGSKETIYLWHISELKIYDKPKELSKFYKACNKVDFFDCSRCEDKGEKACYALEHPPQSWCYVGK